MGKVTFEMTVVIDGLNEMSIAQKEALLDGVIGSMTPGQTRAWIDNSEYGHIIKEYLTTPHTKEKKNDHPKYEIRMGRW